MMVPISWILSGVQLYATFVAYCLALGVGLAVLGGILKLITGK